MRPSHISIFLGFLWSLTLGFGFHRLWAYEAVPGASAKPPTHFAEAAGFPHEPGQKTLIMLAHPRCPCTRASIEALARLMAQREGSLVATVLFVRPEGVPGGWEKSDMWRSAAAIPNVRVVSDEEGTLARRFGGATSGQVLLYNEAGRLLFEGGITSARGQAGDNVGSGTIRSLVSDTVSAQTQTPVFGCSLFGVAANPTEGRSTGR